MIGPVLEVFYKPLNPISNTAFRCINDPIRTHW